MLWHCELCLMLPFSSTALLNETISVLNALMNGQSNRLGRQPLFIIESVWIVFVGVEVSGFFTGNKKAPL